MSKRIKQDLEVNVSDKGSLNKLGASARKAGKNVGSVARNVQDSDRFGVSYSGRVKSGTTGSLVLDREVLFLPTSTYELNLVITEPSAFYTASAPSSLTALRWSPPRAELCTAP